MPYKVDIYAGSNASYTLNTLCATWVLPEGVFLCQVTATYITIVLVDNPNTDYIMLQEWRVFSEQEVG